MRGFFIAFFVRNICTNFTSFRHCGIVIAKRRYAMLWQSPGREPLLTEQRA